MFLVFPLLVLMDAVPQPGIPLLEECSTSSPVTTVLARSDSIQVRFSIAEDAGTCYAVNATHDGQAIKGYLLDKDVPAVAAYEKDRRLLAANSLTKTPSAATTELSSAAPEAALPVFKNFSGFDLKGTPVSLNGAKGKLTLVCFWSPVSNDAIREAILVTRLVGQFRSQGVRAVTVALTYDKELMGEGLEAVTVPTVFGGYDIAAKNGVDWHYVPKTFILNERHEILAAGLHGAELEKQVRLLTEAR